MGCVPPRAAVRGGRPRPPCSRSPPGRSTTSGRGGSRRPGRPGRPAGWGVLLERRPLPCWPRAWRCSTSRTRHAAPARPAAALAHPAEASPLLSAAIVTAQLHGPGGAAGRPPGGRLGAPAAAAGGLRRCPCGACSARGWTTRAGSRREALDGIGVGASTRCCRWCWPTSRVGPGATTRPAGWWGPCRGGRRLAEQRGRGPGRGAGRRYDAAFLARGGGPRRAPARPGRDAGDPPGRPGGRGLTARAPPRRTAGLRPRPRPARRPGARPPGPPRPRPSAPPPA